MQTRKKAVFPRFNVNLARVSSADEPPVAGTVAVTFNASNGAVTLPANADISVDKNKMKVMFDLTAQNVPAGAAAVIQGVEFSKPNEPTGTNAPTNVFEDSTTFTDQNGNSHTVFGKWQGGNKHELKLVDNNPVRGGSPEQDYGYKVWVKVTSGATTSYYASPDPTVKNEPTTGP